MKKGIMQSTFQELGAAIELANAANENIISLMRKGALRGRNYRTMKEGVQMLLGKVAALESLLDEKWHAPISQPMPEALINSDY